MDNTLKNHSLFLLGLAATATTAFAQGPPDIVWEVDAPATHLTFAPDGATMYTGGQSSVAASSYGNIKRWDVASGTEDYTLVNDGTGAIGLTNALAVAPDGTTFASGHGTTDCPAQGPCVEVAIGFHAWDAASGTAQFSVGAGDIDGLVEAVAFSQDGEFVAFTMSRSNQNQVRVYDYPEYTLHGSYAGHGNATACAAFSPTSNLLATGGSDGEVQLWDVDTNQLVNTLVHGTYTNGGTPISVAFSPDGSQLAVSGRGYALNATVWDVSTGTLVHSLPAGAGAFGTSAATVAFSPNGSYLVAGVSRYVSPEWGGLIRIWNVIDGSLVREYTEASIGSVGSPLFVAVSPASDDWIAYTYDDKVKFAATGLDLQDAPGTPYCFGDGSGTACPCGNPGTPGQGCANSNGTGAVVHSTGSTSVSTDDLVFTGTNLLPSQPALLFAGVNSTNGGSGNLLGDGLRCAGGGVVRLGVQIPNAMGQAAFGPGLAALGGFGPGELRRFQVWYRDPVGPCGSGFNLSHGIEVSLIP